MGLLCNFAHRFPQLAAEILERDRGKLRHFREETITDLLMAGMLPFEPFGIRTDFPVNESVTGEDMDWEFVDEHAAGGQHYLRLHIQAKRAHYREGKRISYWFYKSIDHAVGSPKLFGAQHTALIDEAKKIAGCVPLYMFYHPISALGPTTNGLPAVEGVNWLFADLIPKKIGSKSWSVKDKKLEKWQPHFHTLSELLCFGPNLDFGILQSGRPFALATPPSLNWPTPTDMARRLNTLRDQTSPAPDTQQIEPVAKIPTSTLNAIRATREHRRPEQVERRRVIFFTGHGLSGTNIIIG